MTTAAEVINQQAQLTTAWRNPNRFLEGFVEGFAQDVVNKRGPKGAGKMFSPMESTRIVRPWILLVGKDLFTARTFQVNATMCDVVSQLYRASRTFNGPPVSVSYDELPAESGFVWFDEPPRLLDIRKKMTRPRAMSWAMLNIPHDDGTMRPGIRMVTWADAHITNDYDSQWTANERRHVERDLGRLQMEHVFILPLDFEVLDDPNANPFADHQVAWFHTLCMVLGTEISARGLARLPKSVLGSLKKLVKHPEVTVVTLRRIAPQINEDHVSIPVDWSCTWVVQGHHRHIDSYEGKRHHATPIPDDRGHCAICRKRITWVRPYVKGPDGMPLKTSDIVYRLER